MKKLFITLLLSIIWFIGFSSAYSLIENISFVPSSKYFFPSSLVWQEISVNCSWQDWFELFFSCAERYFPSWSSSIDDILISEWCSIISYNATASCSYSYNSSVLPFNQLFVLLNPAWDGLKNSFYVIIPYVVYIWIWLLVCTLWFYAIRWLVNWIWIKVNSVFKSKRN